MHKNLKVAILKQIEKMQEKIEEIKKPEITKKISTPVNPPFRLSGKA